MRGPRMAATASATSSTATKRKPMRVCRSFPDTMKPRANTATPARSAEATRAQGPGATNSCAAEPARTTPPTSRAIRVTSLEAEAGPAFGAAAAAAAFGADAGTAAAGLVEGFTLDLRPEAVSKGCAPACGRRKSAVIPDRGADPQARNHAGIAEGGGDDANAAGGTGHNRPRGQDHPAREAGINAPRPVPGP